MFFTYWLAFLLLTTGADINGWFVPDTCSAIALEHKDVNYGKVEQNSDKRRVLQITNVSDEPFVFTNCRSSCGCMVPQCPREEILPGDTAEIKVSYDTKRLGPFTKTITVSISACEGAFRIKVHGEVFPEEQLVPDE